MDYSGQRFGMITVIEKAPRPEGGIKNAVYWRCVCDCGNEIVVSAHRFRHHVIYSCGCTNSPLLKKHGLRHTRIYHAWSNMKYRCKNKNCKYYDDYGGRGIYVCDEWDEPDGDPAKGFMNFYNWSIEHGGYYDQSKDTQPRDVLSIERIDNDGPYAPWNCKWIPLKYQCANRRISRIIEINGERNTLRGWSRKCDIASSTLQNRLNRGYSEFDAIYKPAIKKKVKHCEDGFTRNADGFIVLTRKHNLNIERC